MYKRIVMRLLFGVACLSIAGCNKDSAINSTMADIPFTQFAIDSPHVGSISQDGL